MDGCRTELEAALPCLNSALERIQAGGPSAAAGLAPEAIALRTELQQTVRLLEEANRFYEDWLRLKATLTAGYDPQGRPAALEETRRGLAEA